MNILIFKNRALGDSVMGLSSVQYIKSLYPQSKVIYGVPSWVAPLYDKVKTRADEIIPIDLSSYKSWLKLWKTLKIKKISHVHELHQSGRGAKFFKLYSFFNNVRYTFHNHHLTHDTGVLDQGIIKSLIQRDLDGVYSYFSTRDEKLPSHFDFEPSLNVTGSLHNQKKIIFFGVVATRQTKMWSLKSYYLLAKLISENFPDYKIIIPLSKSKSDFEIQEKLTSFGIEQYCEFLKVSLGELVVQMSKGKFYIGNDTGLKHIAISLGLKTWTFFGPEPPLEWHPYNLDNHSYFYREGLECRTRTHHYCGLSDCDMMDCLNFFTPNDIFEVIKKTL